MTWTKTLTYWVLALLLGGYYWQFERETPQKIETKVHKEKVLPFFLEDVNAVTLRADGRELHSKWDGEKRRWQVVVPTSAQAPSDLFVALIESLTKTQDSEVIATSPSDTDVSSYGLASPAWVLEVVTKAGKTSTVEFGDRNPPSTAIYARTKDSPKIYLVGLNVEYYGDLIFEAAFPSAERVAG